MSLFAGLGGIAKGIGLVSDVVSIGTTLYGGKKTSDALEDQAAAIGDLSARERAFIREQAEIEADLLEQQGADQAEVLEFNRRVALENAEWERQSGEIAMRQAEKQWEAHIGNVVATFAASGTRLTGTTNDVIMEQVAEAEQDFFVLGLNSERAVSREEDRARLFSLQQEQTERRAREQAKGRRRVGELEAEIAGTSAAARASAARTQASTSRIGTLGSAFSGFANLAGDVAEIYG